MNCDEIPDKTSLEAALKDAQSQGLPIDWTVVLNSRDEKVWTSPQSKTFKSLPKALAHVRQVQAELDKLVKKKPKKTKKRSAASMSSSSANSKNSNSNANTSASHSTKVTGSTTSASQSQSSSSTAKGNKSTKKRKKGKRGSVKEEPINDETMVEDPPVTTKSNTKPKSSTKQDSAESDPETSLDIPRNYEDATSPIKPIHWDPHSVQGQQVGYRIRVFDFTRSRNDWASGRIIRYDPISHKHKVAFFTGEHDVEESWIDLRKEHIQLGGRFVWALVKGFAWWPAQVLHCHYNHSRPMPKSTNSNNAKDLTTQPVREGNVLVEFFDSDEVASIKDTLDFIRPFVNGNVQDDAVISKHKKKRNKKAIESGIQEQEATKETRNDAARFYAEKAFDCVNAKANYFLGMKVKIFRSDVNYPVGDHVTGVVRQYSLLSKKWLVAYDAPPLNKAQYEANWVNLSSKGCSYKVMDGLRGSKRKSYRPNDFDIYPYLFGFEGVPGVLSASDSRCRGCASSVDLEQEVVLTCTQCAGHYHPGCLDPPISKRSAETILRSDEKWVCNRCVRCVGCRQFEIAFGSKTIPTPPSLHLDSGDSLDLCSSCIPLYEKEMYCPVCSHTWDDVNYQKVKKKFKKQEKKEGTPKLNTLTETSSSGNHTFEGTMALCKPVTDADPDQKPTFCWKSAKSLDPSWFYPETEVWGYNEGTMIACDKCKLWVHAGCSQLSKEEYEETNLGNHPIYSKEFLCRTCCTKQCQTLMDLLIKEDTMFLFANPVTDQVAHNYSDVIKEPMDLQTMSERASGGSYRNYAWLREAFELMVNNALTFNIANTAYWKEAQRYHKACLKKIFSKQGLGAPPSKYDLSIQANFAKAERDAEAERMRTQTDATTEKKDLVAGSQVTSITVGPLSEPPDPPSCVFSTEVRLTPVEAFYSAWKEACFTCGSSGASDTMLFCVDCGEAYHSFCANAPIHSMNQAAINSWRCPNCKLCEISGDDTVDETKLLYCEMCDRAFSINLIEPPLSEIPSGLWICGQCVDCTKCENTTDGDKVSRKFWSRNPQKCLPCGGCEGLALKELKGRRYQKQRQDVKKEKVERGKHQAKEVIGKTLKKVKSKAIVKEGTLVCATEQIKKVTVKKQKKLKPKVESKEEALVTAMKEAQKRGLPEGWTVFYGAANRKRWRSPGPSSRTFDSIPKALLFVQKVKDGLASPSPKKSSSAQKKKKDKIGVDLLAEPEWINRTKSSSKNQSIINDANIMLSILDKSVGFKLSGFLDGVKVGDINKATKARAVRFARFAKRVKKKKVVKDRIRDLNSEIVICQMASAFLVTTCLLLGIELNDVLTYPKEIKSFLEQIDDKTGTVLKALEASKTKKKVNHPQSFAAHLVQVSQDIINRSVHPELQGHISGSPSKDSFLESQEVTYPPGQPVTVNRHLGNSHMPLKKRKDPLIIKNEVDLAKEFAASALMELISPDRAKMKSPVPKKMINSSISQIGSISHTKVSEDSISNPKPILGENANAITAKKSDLDQILGQNEPVKEIRKLDTVSSAQELNQSIVSMPFCAEGKDSDLKEDVSLPSRVFSEDIKRSDEQQSDLTPATITMEKQKDLLSPNSGREKLNSQKDPLVPSESTISSIINPSKTNNIESTVVLSGKCKDALDTNVCLDGKEELKNNIDAKGNAEENGNSVTLGDETVKKDENSETHHINTSDREMTSLQNNGHRLETNTQSDNKSVVGENPVIAANNSNEDKSSATTQPLAEDQNQEDIIKKTPLDEALEKGSCIVIRKLPKVELPWNATKSYKVHPMAGWNSGIHAVGTNNVWVDSRRCCLCNTCGDDDAEQSGEGGKKRSLNRNEITRGGSGRLLPIPGGGWIHSLCAVWSSEVWENPNGGMLNSVHKSRSRGSKLKCFGCGKPGATIGCHKVNCPANFHFACAKACGVVFTDNHKLYCSAHKDCAKGDQVVSFDEPMKTLRVSGDKEVILHPDCSCYRIGTLVVHSLGKIEEDNDGFHSESYITPPGFSSSRIFWSYIHEKRRTVYFMRIERSPRNKARFCLIAADDFNSPIESEDIFEVYNELMKRVSKMYKKYFSDGDMYSVHPMRRKKSKKKHYCLNGPQFFGFGLDNIRRALESSSGSVSSAVPLGDSSIPYKFCFVKPSEDNVMDLQRKRAAALAEKALENASGCARTEGLSAVDKSSGSGRITRALVRQANEDTPNPSKSTDGAVGGKDRISESKQDLESNQAKYDEMKSVSMERRLAAKRSHIHGWGLFAKRNYPKHSMIAEYMGETVRQSIADKREKEYEVLGMGSCYMFRLDMQHIVDATRIGCMARFMNHCCAANAYAKIVTVSTELGLEKKIVVFANQDINAGDEITYDYKFPVEDGSLRCTCGAPNCIGRMN